MKLYDGRGKRFKKLIDYRRIMKENRLAISEVIPRYARAKWYSIWIRGSTGFVIAMCLFIFVSETAHFLFFKEHYLRPGEIIEYFWKFVYLGIFIGWLSMLTERRRTWASKTIAIRTLAQNGFCPNCGYIIGDTPPESDGCVPCSECGYAWRIEPINS